LLCGRLVGEFYEKQNKDRKHAKKMPREEAQN